MIFRNKISFTTQFEVKKPVKNYKKITNPNLGTTKPICPYCNTKLEKFPKQAIKCKNCNNKIYTRTRPFDNKKILLTEAELETLLIDEAKKYGKLKEYIINKKENEEKEKKFEEKRIELQKLYNKPYVEDHQVKWILLNENKNEATRNFKLRTLKEVLNEMGTHLFFQKQYKLSIKYYLKAATLDTCKATDDKNNLFINHYLLEIRTFLLRYFVEAMKKENLTIEDVKKMFFEDPIEFKNILPLSMEEIWIHIENEIKEIKTSTDSILGKTRVKIVTDKDEITLDKNIEEVISLINNSSNTSAETKIKLIKVSDDYYVSSNKIVAIYKNPGNNQSRLDLGTRTLLLNPSVDELKEIIDKQLND